MEKNRLIAEFMGWRKSKYSYPFTTKQIERKELLYHHDWDWLMPVVEKICRMEIGDDIEYVKYAYPRTFGMLDEENKLMVRLNGFFIHRADNLLEATFSAVVEFIEYYNEHKVKADSVSKGKGAK